MLLITVQLHLSLLQVLPLDFLPPSPGPSSNSVYPRHGSGFAASIIGGFFGIGVLIVAMILMGTKPRRRSNRR